MIPTTPFKSWAAVRTRRMHRARFTLQSDVSQFYNSIYTHAIPWALVGKRAEKARVRTRGTTVLGNWIDAAVSKGQEGQTRGIPIGPDTSLVIAELILCDVDAELASQFPQLEKSATRWMDDIHVFTSSHAEAEEVLLAWESQLASYELLLNPDKTYISEGPAGFQTPWRTQLTQFGIRDSDAKAANDLRDYFGVAFDLARDNPRDSVISYAIAALRGRRFGRRAWRTLIDLLLPAVIAEPSSLRFVSEALERGRAQGARFDLDRISATLSDIVAHHAPLEHAADVSWALWILVESGAELTAAAAAAAAKMEDSVSLVLLRYLVELDIVAGAAPDLSEIEIRASSPESLVGRDWLLAYEYAAHGWIAPTSVLGDPFFSQLRDATVFFFNPEALASSRAEATTDEREPEPTPEPEPEAVEIEDLDVEVDDGPEGYI